MLAIQYLAPSSIILYDGEIDMCLRFILFMPQLKLVLFENKKSTSLSPLK